MLLNKAMHLSVFNFLIGSQCSSQAAETSLNFGCVDAVELSGMSPSRDYIQH